MMTSIFDAYLADGDGLSLLSEQYVLEDTRLVCLVDLVYMESAS